MLVGGLMGEVGRWWDGQLVGWLVDEMGGVMGGHRKSLVPFMVVRFVAALLAFIAAICSILSFVVSVDSLYTKLISLSATLLL